MLRCGVHCEEHELLLLLLLLLLLDVCMYALCSNVIVQRLSVVDTGARCAVRA